MKTIDGYPEQSMTGQLLTWGRADSYAPFMVPSPESVDELRAVQEALSDRDPESTPIDSLHITLLFCPPKHIFDAIRAQTGRQYDPSEEALFYSDISNALSTAAMFSIRAEPMPVEALELFDDSRGIVVLRLARVALLAEWRQKIRDLMLYNLRSYHGLTDARMQVLGEDPKLKWLFAPSHPHITIAKGVSPNTELASVPLPDNVYATHIVPDSPGQFFGFNSLRFDPDAAYEEHED